MFVKGQKRHPNAGRKKGTPNKATVRRRLAEAEGVAAQLKSIQSTEMPLDFMLRKMRDPTESPYERNVMARAAAPYCHAQLQAVAHQHVGADGQPIAPMISVTIVQHEPASVVAAGARW
jgi:hypothetical protein